MMPMPKNELSRPLVGTAREWVLVTLGLCVLGFIVVDVVSIVPTDWPTTWSAVNGFLYPVMVPMFFFAAGYAGRAALTMPWGGLLSRWILPLAGLYVVTAALETAHWWWLLGSHQPAAEPTWELWLWNIRWGMHITGMVYSLPVFLLILGVSRYVPGPLRWVLSILPVAYSVLATYPLDERVLRYVVYLPVFLLGAYGARLLEKYLQEAMQPPVAGLALALWVAAFFVTNVPYPERWHLAGDVLYALCFLPAGASLGLILAQMPVCGRLALGLGRRFLSLYLLHSFTFVWFFGLWLVPGAPLLERLGEFFWLRASWWIILLVALAVGSGLLLSAAMAWLGNRNKLFTSPVISMVETVSDRRPMSR